MFDHVSGPPVEVGVTMYVLSISSVSEVLMVHIYTETHPARSRLAYRDKSRDTRNGMMALAPSLLL